MIHIFMSGVYCLIGLWMVYLAICAISFVVAAISMMFKGE